MEDITKKRREYLRKKAKVLVPAFIVGCLSLLLIVFVLKLAGQPGTMSNTQFVAFVLAIVLMVPCTIAIIASEKKALSIAYVPPVAEQITTLPADEVLLRGSDQPTAKSDELLRAAQPGQELATEELLRPIAR